MKKEFISTCIGLLLTTSVLAHSPHSQDPKSFTEMVANSDLIFAGEVLDIVYKNSEPTESDPIGVPFTFVSYRIEKVFRGKPSDELITLRFRGGADLNGGFLMESIIPIFATGQRDVLFVKQDENRECPLVACADGRFRILEGGIYNAWGIPVVEIDKTVRVGGQARYDVNYAEIPRPSFEVLVKRPELQKLLKTKFSDVPLKELKARYLKEAPKFARVSIEEEVRRADSEERKDRVKLEPKFEKPIQTSVFLDQVSSIAKRSPKVRGSFRSEDVNKPFKAVPRIALALEVKEELEPKIDAEKLEEIQNDEAILEGRSRAKNSDGEN